MSGCDRSGGSEEDKAVGFVDRLTKFFTPLFPWRNALVIPDIDPLLLQPRNLRVNKRAVLVRIANENVRLVPAIGWRRLLQETPPVIRLGVYCRGFNV